MRRKKDRSNGITALYERLSRDDEMCIRDRYNAWRKQAQMALSKYQLGEISWAEFVDSLTCSSKAE